MSYKVHCPGCDSYSSTIAAAVDVGDPCPQCGLPADDIARIEAIRCSRATDKLKQQVEELIIRAGKAETRAERAERQLQDIRDVLESTDGNS
jgi:hypothetical protein